MVIASGGELRFERMEGDSRENRRSIEGGPRRGLIDPMRAIETRRRRVGTRAAAKSP
jgi:hypothetical protein